MGRARLEDPCTGKSRHSQSQQTSSCQGGPSLLPLLCLPPQATQVGFWGTLQEYSLFVLVNGQGRSADFMYSDLKMSFQVSQISYNWGSIHLSFPQAVMCWGVCQTANRRYAQGDYGKKIKTWWWMTGNIHLCSLYVLISHVSTSKNECMESRSLWNNILGSRDIGHAHGEGIMPGLAGMHQGCRQLDALSCGERGEVYSQSAPIFRKRLVTSSFSHGKLSPIRWSQSLL